MESSKQLQCALPAPVELEVTCYISRRDGGSRTSCYTGEAFLTKQFRIEVAVSGSAEGGSSPLNTTVCRKCREVLLHEFELTMPFLGREERWQQVHFLLKHRPRDEASGFRVVALFDGGSQDLCLPREEESCPLCKFALSPFDRASSLSEQSLSRGYSPPSVRRESCRRENQVGDAPFATQVTPQGEVIQRKPRPVRARQDFISPSDLQVKPGSGQEAGAGLHRHVSLTVSNFKYSPHASSCPRRSKSSCHAHRNRTSYVEEDRLQTLKKGLLQRHRPRGAASLSLHELSAVHSSQQHVKSCRVM